MRLKIGFSLALAVLLASGAGLSVSPRLHPAGGLLSEDPDTLPGMTVLSEIPGWAKAAAASAVDLSAEMPPVGDQGNQGSCVAWAVGYYDKTHAEYAEHGWNDSTTDHEISPAFVYNQINGGQDGGAYMSDAQMLICDQGSCMLSDFPYNDNDCTTWPSEAAFEDGISYRGSNYSAVKVTTNAGINSVKNLLAAGQTCVLGINVYQNFDYIEDYNYTYTVHDRTGYNRGGHSVCIVGYDDNKATTDGKGAFKLANSWGTGWGLSGYWWMSYYAVKTTAANLSQGYVYVTNDRTGYSPTALARVELTHPSRDRIGITFGIGTSKKPLWTKAFRQFQILKGAIVDQPFPNDNLVFDLSDGASYFSKTDSVYVRCIDTKKDNLTGSINFLSATYNGRTGSSTKTVAIPDCNVAVFDKVVLPPTLGPQRKPVGGSQVASRAEFRDGTASVTFELARPGLVRITVYDAMGRMLAASTTDAQSGRNELRLKLRRTAGVCFYRIESGSTSMSGKLATIR